MEGKSQSRGIYRRFMNLIRSKLNRPSGTEVPVEEGIISKTNGFLGSEIVVEFRHTDGSEISTQINDQTILHNKERKRQQELEGLERNVTIRGIDEEGDRMKKRDAHEEMKRKHTRPKKPPLSVDPNINVKCDEYIKRRKGEMEESYYQKQQS
ncbi:hypothetical protein CDL12_19737 [Handroanthus impetiginosus]|uniref:Uncharacterized protein n=1 Tax=Handroanthus impetiginosus TaxID=429701 RepID=A0A2G9GRP6_9LAMI|nr:hypothetical protein CDL12_19737 [Handroanthus impetiginosus]